MGLTDELLAVGDWVIVDSGFARGWVGYILQYDSEDDRFRVRLTSDEDGKATDFKKWFDSDWLMPTKVFLKRQDVLALIDLAIDTDDREWFKGLSLQLPKESKVV